MVLITSSCTRPGTAARGGAGGGRRWAGGTGGRSATPAPALQAGTGRRLAYPGARGWGQWSGTARTGLK